jgi:RND family efflux transporter MFP subunit
MKKIKVLGMTALILGAVIGVLLYNKSKMEAMSRTDVLSSIPVSVSTVGPQRAGEARDLVGSVAANNDVAIVSETQGRVVKVMAEVGDYKPAGSVIAQVDDELKRANFATAEVNYLKAKRDMERFESLVKEDAATDQQVEAARLASKSAEAQFITARREYADTKITTPISGTVTSRPVDVGTYVQKGMAVANVVDISRLKVNLNVSERDVFRLKAGDTVEISTNVYPGAKFEGTIHTISVKADEAHTYPVEVLLTNSKEHPLKTGMFATVQFRDVSNGDVLAIPRAALVGSLKRPQVFVVENGMARLRDIIVDAEIGTNLTVVSGLRSGETVVTNGQNNLRDNVPITIVN